jgi:hypothetical protein
MTKSASESLEAMNEELRSLFERIREDLTEARGNGMAAYYRAAGRIRCAKEGRATYGENALELIAKGLGMALKTAYRYAAVAKRWSQEEFTDLCARRNYLGLPLSWSHWLLLAGREVDWMTWLERTCAGGWSVKKLRKSIGPVRAKASKKSSDTLAADPATVTRSALRQRIDDAKRALNLGDWSALAHRIRTSDTGISEGDLAGAATDLADVGRRATELRDLMRLLADENATRSAASGATEPVGMLLAGAPSRETKQMPPRQSGVSLRAGPSVRGASPPRPPEPGSDRTRLPRAEPPLAQARRAK